MYTISQYEIGLPQFIEAISDIIFKANVTFHVASFAIVQ